jgi:hemolysin activation/secretion protein
MTGGIYGKFEQSDFFNLGGVNGLRAYPNSTFQNERCYYYTTEFRQGILKSSGKSKIQYILQLSAFYENGKTWGQKGGDSSGIKSDYGIGLRSVIKTDHLDSGVIRLDYSYADKLNKQLMLSAGVDF